MMHRGIEIQARMATFHTISNTDQAVTVASARFIVAANRAAVTNLVDARPGGPGLGFLYLSSQDFDAITGQKELWFKTFHYDPSTMPAIANWGNDLITTLEYIQQF